jgi:hypothetical protein
LKLDRQPLTLRAVDHKPLTRTTRRWRSVGWPFSGRKPLEAERAALEAQLHQAQKYERYASGITHDMDYYLSAIRRSADSALGKLPPDSGARDDLEQIKNAIDRAMGNLYGPFLDVSSRRIGEEALKEAEIVEGPTFRLTELNVFDPCPTAPDQKPIWRAGYAWLCPEPDDPGVWLLWRYSPVVDHWTRIPIRTPRKHQAWRIAGWICGD